MKNPIKNPPFDDPSARSRSRATLDTWRPVMCSFCRVDVVVCSEGRSNHHGSKCGQCPLALFLAPVETPLVEFEVAQSSSKKSGPVLPKSPISRLCDMATTKDGAPKCIKQYHFPKLVFPRNRFIHVQQHTSNKRITREDVSFVMCSGLAEQTLLIHDVFQDLSFNLFLWEHVSVRQRVRRWHQRSVRKQRHQESAPRVAVNFRKFPVCEEILGTSITCADTCGTRTLGPHHPWARCAFGECTVVRLDVSSNTTGDATSGMGQLFAACPLCVSFQRQNHRGERCEPPQVE